jgi:hypothetical protein
MWWLYTGSRKWDSIEDNGSRNRGKNVHSLENQNREQSANIGGSGMGRHGTAHDKNKSGKFHSTMGAVRRLPGFAKLNRHGVSDLVKLRQHLMDESPTAEGERCSTQLPSLAAFQALYGGGGSPAVAGLSPSPSRSGDSNAGLRMTKLCRTVEEGREQAIG